MILHRWVAEGDDQNEGLIRRKTLLCVRKKCRFRVCYGRKGRKVVHQLLADI